MPRILRSRTVTIGLAILSLSLMISNNACQYIGSGKSAEPKSAATTTATAPLGPIKISTVKPTLEQVPRYLQATGSFSAYETTDVASAVAGIVTSTSVEVGDFVTAGQILARLDERDAQMRVEQTQAAVQQAEGALKQAQARIGTTTGFKPEEIADVKAAWATYEASLAQVKLAETNVTRLTRLLETGDIARNSYDQARTQLETSQAQTQAARQQYEVALNLARQSVQAITTAQASLEGARTQQAIAQKALADGVIKAPFAGFISERITAVGEYVTPNSRIATIVKIQPIKLTLQIPEADAGQIQPGMAITATVAAYPGVEFVGKVTALIPGIDANSRALQVLAVIENPGSKLRPGMFATVQVLQTQNQEALFVPASAVVRDNSTNSTYLYVLDGNIARVRLVQVGQKSADKICISAGLNNEESVIVSNLGQLFDGATVIFE
jgi:multidrug efflux pump subunit AcrA (membrane-fusion protein)